MAVVVGTSISRSELAVREAACRRHDSRRRADESLSSALARWRKILGGSKTTSGGGRAQPGERKKIRMGANREIDGVRILQY